MAIFSPWANEDESERGCVLINSRQGWHTEMVNRISNARATEADKDSDDDSDAVTLSCLHLPAGPGSRSLQWKSTTLAILFGDWKEPPSQLHRDEINTKAVLTIQALAECEKDNRLDDSTVEINSDNEFTG